MNTKHTKVIPTAEGDRELAHKILGKVTVTELSDLCWRHVRSQPSYEHMNQAEREELYLDCMIVGRLYR